MTTPRERLIKQIGKVVDSQLQLRVHAADALTGAVNARMKADGCTTAEAMLRIAAQLTATLKDPEFETIFGRGGKHEGV